MKRLAFTVPLAGMLLILSTATALAGIEPVPFNVQRAKLTLVAQLLSGATDMIDAVLGVSPEPFCPVPADVMADEIRDLAKQTQRHEERVERCSRITTRLCPRTSARYCRNSGGALATSEG